MNSKKLNDWLQILGMFGVIGSLVFVGMQLKQTQAIALSETYQNRTSSAIDLNTGAMGSSEFLTAVSKVYRNAFDELTMPEAVALEYYVGTDMMIIENNHLQFQSGFLTEEHWQRNLRKLRCMLMVPMFRDVARDWKFRESFRQEIEDIMNEIPSDAENCWVYDWNFPMS